MNFDEQPPQARAEGERMVREILQGGMDLVQVMAMQVGHSLTETDLQYVQMGIQSGMTATIEWLTREDLLRR